MMKTYYQEICQGVDVRANLIRLREAASSQEGKRSLAYLLGGDFHVLTALLGHADPKVRKNAALILGLMETEDVLPALMRAYEKETTLYVRPSYLKAAMELDCRPWLKMLRERAKQIDQMETEEESLKHLQEERGALQKILLRYDKVKKHEFTGGDRIDDVILLTNREQREVTAQQVTAGKVTFLGSGIRVKGGSFEELKAIRTWKEMLLPLPVKPLAAQTPSQLGRMLARLKLAETLDQWHVGESAYYYRLEIRSDATVARRGEMIRQITSTLDAYSGGRLRNSPSDYEVEIRLTRRQDGTWIPLLKLFTFRDARFLYRERSVAGSMAPDNAALAVRLALPYLKKGAQVLDPFCGTGTLLIERRLALETGDMYGTDILEEAVEGARVNAAHIGMKIAFIHRNFFDFTHEYLFDELITDLDPRADRAFCASFLKKAAEHLKEGAVLVLYTTAGDCLQDCAREQGTIAPRERFLISERTGTEVMVFVHEGEKRH